VRSGAFAEVGGFDQRFTGWGHEDDAFYYSLRRKYPLGRIRREPGLIRHLWHNPQNSPEYTSGPEYHNSGKLKTSSFLELKYNPHKYWKNLRLLNGILYTVKPTKFEYKIRGLYEVTKMCLPLKLAWACSIHSSQGLTLDCAMADLGSSIFDYGQSYVVLSRVKNIESISLFGLDIDKIKANSNVLLRFYPEIHTIIYVLSEYLNDKIKDNMISYLL
jgi:hypothetical protein